MCVLAPPYIRRPNHALGILHGDAPAAALNEDDGGDDEHHHDQEQNQPNQPHLAGAQLIERRDDGMRQSDDNARINDERHAVADTALGNLLAEPHDERCARRQR
jgi:hypothetical protein